MQTCDDQLMGRASVRLPLISLAWTGSKVRLYGPSLSMVRRLPRGAKPVPGWKGCAAAAAASSAMAPHTKAACTRDSWGHMIAG